MTKFTLKLVLRKSSPKANGMMPIYVRMIADRKATFISTGIAVPEKHWDLKKERIKTGFPDADLWNLHLDMWKNDIYKKAIEANMADDTMSPTKLKSKIVIKKSTKPTKSGTNIFEFIKTFSTEVNHKRQPGTLENYKKHARKLELYFGSTELTFEDIDPKFLSDYEIYLRKTVGANYTHALWKTLKTFFNAAKKRKLITCYPFDEYENPVYRAPDKEHLSLDDLKKWEEFADTTTNMVYKQTAIYFLLGCYTGLRISDWRTFSLEDNVLKYHIRMKTKKNGEIVTMTISDGLRRNLERMKQVPLKIEEPTINEKLKEIAKLLKIKKRITSHTGRHTFAVTMCSENGMGVEPCAKLMGITVKTCLDNYYKITQIALDKECERAWKRLQ